MRPSQIAADRQYWATHLAGRGFVAAAFPGLSDPAARTGPRTEPRVEHAFALSDATAAGVLRLAGDSDLALFTLLLAGLRHLLFRYTGEQRLAIASARFAPAAALPGSESRLLLARTINPAETFRDAMLAERETVRDARRHQAFPFARARAWLESAAADDMNGVGLMLDNVQPAGTAPAPALAPLEFHFSRRANGAVTGRVVHDVERYAPAYVAQLVQHLDRLLGAGVANTETTPATVDLLDAAARSALWRNAAAGPVGTATIGEAFAAQVAQAGDHVALRCLDRQLTYTELDRRTNRLAHHLLDRGLRPEEPVALWLGRSIEVVIGMLGILKAGGCYLPLDPAFPAARTRFMLEDAGARCVLGVGSPPTADAAGSESAWIDLDANAAWWAEQPDTPPPDSSGPESLAYLLYTSGTTGQPKGVPITHTGVVHLAQCDQLVPGAAGETLLLQSALTFDASTIEIWTALLNGAQLVIDPENRRSLAEAAAWQEQQGVTAMLNTTALFHVAAQEEPPAIPPARTLLVGGDALSARHARRFLNGFSGRLLNIYGPTEHAVVATWHSVDLAGTEDDPVPIGRPLGANEVCILNDSLLPVPPGVVGELYLGGPGLARGYRRRPGLTAEHFIPHPFSDAPGARLYRSGDLGRFRLNGVIEFVGRRDDQVKVRGFRIELGEVESHLVAHPGTRNATVIAATDDHGGKRLLAFMVAQPGHEPTGAELREFLRARMPEHQIPAAFYFRDDLPLNAHGKIDRARLHALTKADAPQTAAPPRTPAEKTIAAIWQEVLGRNDFNVHDDFFDVGGDSLSAMQVLARINKSGRSLSARRFFRQPTIAGCVEAAQLPGPGGTAPLAPPTGEVPLTAIQHWFFDACPIDPHFFNLSLMLEVISPLDPAQVARAVTAVIRHHDALQLVFSRQGADWQARYAQQTDEALFTFVNLSALPAAERVAEQTRRATLAQRALDLDRGPLFHGMLFRQGSGQRDRLLLVAHHLVIDLLSWRIVLDDLDAALGAVLARQTVTLPGGSDRFGTWAQQLPAYLQTPAADTGRRYWLALAEKHRTKPHLDDRGTVRTEALLQRRLTADRTAEVLKAASTLRASMEELLLAALLLAHRPTADASSVVAVNLDRHGRTETIGNLDVSRTVGWFTAVVPVYFDLPLSPSLPEALAVVQETLRHLPNRGVDFGILRFLGAPDERQQLAALPLPTLSLNFQGEFDSDLERLKNLALSADDPGEQRSEDHHRNTRFDLDVRVVAGELEFYATTREAVRDDGTEPWLDTIVSTLEQLAKPAEDSGSATNPASVSLPSRHVSSGR